MAFGYPTVGDTPLRPGLVPEADADAGRGTQPFEGYLRKCGKNLSLWHYRYARLTMDGNLQTFTEKPGQGSAAAKTLVDNVRGASAASADFRLVSNGFRVTTSSQTVYLAADTPAMRTEWLLALQRAGAKLGPGDLPAQPPAEGASPTQWASHATASPAAAGSGSSAQDTPGTSSPARAAGAASPSAKGAPPKKASAPRPPPPPKGKAKAEPKAKSTPKAYELPIERRIHVTAVQGSPNSQIMASTIKAAPVVGGMDIFRPKSTSASRVPQPHGRHAAAVRLLDVNKAFTLQIHLHKGLDTQALAGALERLAPDECNINPEDALRLVEVLPKESELKPIAAYGTQPGEDPEQLHEVERMLRPLAQLTRLEQRLHILRLSMSLGVRLNDAMTQMKKIQEACDAVRCSGIFVDLLKIVNVIFNFCNFGVLLDAEGVTVRQVDVHSLMRLQETKAYGGPFPRYNMLHHALEQLLRQRPELDRADLQRQLGDLPKAATLSLGQLQLGLASLKEDLEFVRGELYGHKAAYAPFQEEAEGDEAPEGEAPEPTESEEPHTVRLDSQDVATDSDEESVSRASSSCSWGRARRGLLERLLGQAIDALSFVQAWKEGNAEFGRADPFVDATLPEDADLPPPGMLRRYRPSGIARKYWCEVRGPLLICYRVDNGRVLGTSYVVLTAADIFPVDNSMCISGLGPPEHAFEVRPHDPRDGRNEKFVCHSAEEVWRWVALLEEQAHRPGFGYLSLHKGGWHVLGSCWQRLFFVLVLRGRRPSTGQQAEAAGPRLLAFSRPKFFANGTAPEQSWDLSDMVVHRLDSEGASEEAKKLSEAVIGLELQEYETGKRWRFACDSIAEQRSWLQAFESVLGRELEGNASSASGMRPMRHTLIASFRDCPDAEVDRTQLFDLFSEAGTPADLPGEGPEKTAEHPASMLSFSLLAPGPVPASGPLSLRPASFNVAAEACGASSSGATSTGLTADAEGAASGAGGAAHSSSSHSGSSYGQPAGAAEPCPSPLSPAAASVGPAAEAEGAAPGGGGAASSSGSGGPLGAVPEHCEEDAPVVAGEDAPAVAEEGLPAIREEPCEPFDGDDAAADEEAEEEPVEVPDALSQLRRLEEDMVGATEKWGRMLTATQSHCRGLLRFYSLEPPEGDGLALAAEQLLGALGTFETQVAAAWADLDNHRRTGAAEVGRIPSAPREGQGPHTPRTKVPRRSSTRSSVSSEGPAEDARQLSPASGVGAEGPLNGAETCTDVAPEAERQPSPAGDAVAEGPLDAPGPCEDAALDVRGLD